MKITFDFSDLKEHMNELYVFFKKYKKIFMVFILIGILLSSAMNTFILDKKYQATTLRKVKNVGKIVDALVELEKMTPR